MGELLVKERLISPLQLHTAIEMQRSVGGRLGHHLVNLGYIAEDELTAFLSKQYGVPSINLSAFEIDPEVLKILPKEVVTRHQVIPVNRAGNFLIIAMSDPGNLYAIDDVRFITNFHVEVLVASDTAMAEAIRRYYLAEPSPPGARRERIGKDGRDRPKRGRLGQLLTSLGFIDPFEDELAAFFSKQYGVPSINLSAFEIHPEVLEILPKEVVSRHHVIPVNRSGDTLIIAMSDPSDIDAIDDVKFITKLDVEIVVASYTAIAEAIRRHYPAQPSPPGALRERMGTDDRDRQNWLGLLLVEENLISPMHLQNAIEARRSIGGRLGHLLTSLGYIEEDELTAFLSKQYGVPSINLSAFEIDPPVLESLPKEVVSRHQVLPVNRSGNRLIIAMNDPSNIEAIGEVEFATNLDVEVVVASDHAIAEAISRYYPAAQSPPGPGV